MPTAPAGAPASSFTDVNAGLFEASSTGASFTAVTVSDTVAMLESTVPSLAL